MITTAINSIKSGDRVFIQGAQMTPQVLVDELVKHAPRLRNVRIMHLHSDGVLPYTNIEYRDSFIVENLFVGASARQSVAKGNGDYIPIALGSVPAAILDGTLKVDVALVSVRKFGSMYSLGTSVDITKAAVDAAPVVIAQENDAIPLTHGTWITKQQLTHVITARHPIPAYHGFTTTSEQVAIGYHVAKLIENGSCIQLGIGAIPSVVADNLTDKCNIEIFSEMISDPVMRLADAGVTSKITTSFAAGSPAFMRWLDGNRAVRFVPSDRTNNIGEIALHDKFISINAALAVDLYGNVCNDTIGHRHYSGVGGSADFVLGAGYSRGGKSILCLPSTNKRGESTIVKEHLPGTSCSIPRHMVDYICTEFGAVRLKGKGLRERKGLLISIAHPKHRDSLTDN